MIEFEIPTDQTSPSPPCDVFNDASTWSFNADYRSNFSTSYGGGFSLSSPEQISNNASNTIFKHDDRASFLNSPYKPDLGTLLLPGHNGCPALQYIRFKLRVQQEKRTYIYTAMTSDLNVRKAILEAEIEDLEH